MEPVKKWKVSVFSDEDQEWHEIDTFQSREGAEECRIQLNRRPPVLIKIICYSTNEDPPAPLGIG